MSASGSARGTAAAPRSATERFLGEIARRVLGLREVVPTEDLFVECGAGSLMAARIVLAAQSVFPQLTIADLYRRRTVRGVAEMLDGRGGGGADGERGDRVSGRDGDRAEDEYQVVVNHEQQFSVWPSRRAVPDGWACTGVRGRLDACLAEIDAGWRDMRPTSLSGAGAAPSRKGGHLP